MVEYGVRVTWPRRGLRPWLQGDLFTRPDLDCVASLPCNEEGWLIRGGVEVPLVVDPRERGVQPYLAAGFGVASSEETDTSYLLAIGARWQLSWPLAPRFEMRWERVPGLTNVTMVNLGLGIAL